MLPRHRVAGIGGIFFKARDPKALAEWYRTHLGVPVEAGATFASFTAAGPDAAVSAGDTVWSTFPEHTQYERTEDSEFGRFGWATDPEGNRFELWQPKSWRSTED